MSERVTVTVAEEHLDRIGALAERLRAAGMRVDQVHPTIGVITGSVARDDQAMVAKVPGVVAVEKAATYQLPPPDSDIQ